MAQLVNGLYGAYVGKAGNLVGSSRNGRHYFKTAPKKRKKPRKAQGDEKANQSKFSMTHYWLKPLLHFVKVGFKDFRRSGEYNAAKSFLLKNAFEGTPSDWMLNPALVKLSIGDLPLPEDIAVSVVEPGKIQFTWTHVRSINNKINDADQVMMVAYDPKSRDARVKTTGEFRHKGSDILSVGKDKSYHLYVAFSSYDRKTQSDSVYLGEMNM